MQKKVTVKKEVTETRTYCDCCGKEFHWGVCANMLHSCKTCSNIMCDDCRRDYPIENDESLWHDAYDETPHICKDCAKTIGPFAKRLNDLWDDYLEGKKKIKEEFDEVRKNNEKNSEM